MTTAYFSYAKPKTQAECRRIVQMRHPDAWCRPYSGKDKAYAEILDRKDAGRPVPLVLGVGLTEQEAWAKAAKGARA